MTTTATGLPRTLRRVALAMLAALALLSMPDSLRAAETTTLAGDVRGVEICPQVWCGAAVFVGRFDGALDGTSDEGRWWVAVRHEALPLLPGTSAPITGGEWGMVVGERPLQGSIASGAITNNGDGTFTVRPRLDVVEGGEGRLSLAILLDHDVFPPGVHGWVAAGEFELPAPSRLRASTSAQARGE